jgi:hypothetical protein
MPNGFPDEAEGRVEPIIISSAPVLREGVNSISTRREKTVSYISSLHGGWKT